MIGGKNSTSMAAVKERAPNDAATAGGAPLARRSRWMRPRALGLFPLAMLGTFTSLGALALLGIAGAACSQGSASVAAPIELGMTSTAPPYYSDQELTLYEAQKQVPLAIIKPSSSQESALGKGVAPFPHAPYLLASDVTVEIHYTITNVNPTAQTIELLIDPWNEYGYWSPGVTIVDDDDTEPNFSGIDEYFLVQGKSRVEGTITSDDWLNLATNLATVESVLLAPPTNLSVNLGTFCNHVFDIQHRSNDGDPLVTPYIPSVIPGITGFNLASGPPSRRTSRSSSSWTSPTTTGTASSPEGTNEAVLGRVGKVFAPPGALQGN